MWVEIRAHDPDGFQDLGQILEPESDWVLRPMSCQILELVVLGAGFKNKIRVKILDSDLDRGSSFKDLSRISILMRTVFQNWSPVRISKSAPLVFFFFLFLFSDHQHKMIHILK